MIKEKRKGKGKKLNWEEIKVGLSLVVEVH